MRAASYLQGEQVAGVVPGIFTFVNHGCKASTRSHVSEESSNLEDIDEANEESVYSPYIERHFPQWHCGTSRTLRDIQAGEEILDNYVFYGGEKSRSGL